MGTKMGPVTRLEIRGVTEMTDNIEEVVIPSRLPAGTPTVYQKIRDVHYPRAMPHGLIRAFESVRSKPVTVYVHSGDFLTGLDGLEESDRYGYVTCTRGPLKVAMVCHPRSHGGTPFGDVVKLRTVGGRVLWQHPQYHHPKITLCDIDETVDGRRYLAEVLTDGKKHAGFKSMRAAKAWITRMGLTCTAIMDKRGRLAEPKLVLPTEQLRSLIFEEDDWD